MKKILFASLLIFSGMAMNAQTTSTNPGSDNEANMERIRQNQIKNKAAEDALKQQDALNKTNQNKVVLATTTEFNTKNGQRPTENVPKNNAQQQNGKSSTLTPQPVVKTQEAKAEKQDVQPVTNFQKPKGLEPSIVTTNDTKATPAVSKPVNTKGTSIDIKQ